MVWPVNACLCPAGRIGRLHPEAGQERQRHRQVSPPVEPQVEDPRRGARSRVRGSMRSGASDLHTRLTSDLSEALAHTAVMADGFFPLLSLQELLRCGDLSNKSKKSKRVDFESMASC